MENKEQALKSIGHNIQLARLQKGLTQEIVAEECNVSTKYISALERGVSSGSIPLIIDICNLLDITPDYIFKNVLNSNSQNQNVDIFKSELLISYTKLKDENKNFVNHTIEHLYNMQKKR